MSESSVVPAGTGLAENGEGRAGPPGRRRAWRAYLAAELAAMFVVGPLVFAFGLSRPGGWLFPALWAFGAMCLGLLLTDRSFDRRQLWNLRGAREALPTILARFCVFGTVIVAGVLLVDRLWLDGSLFLSLPRRNPQLWVVIMFAYPVFSVWPQEVIWRAFFFHRYSALFGRAGQGTLVMIGSSAAAFAFAHVVFENALAIGMCMVGGLFFAGTYARSRSTLAACIEHSLYGCLVFTVGIGRYFYAGAVGE